MEPGVGPFSSSSVVTAAFCKTTVLQPSSCMQPLQLPLLIGCMLLRHAPVSQPCVWNKPNFLWSLDCTELCALHQEPGVQL